ncbi:hypothetical protein ACT3CD_09165 [Geofilum sp. OHC36d9]|uniref:hypothetical protein n=1 Tax=Geofilum sp. OHC36d9 TaxID=3458413 RepID=UPI00403447AB
MNNSLIYTDPSGEFIFTALALIIPGGQAFLPMAIGADIGMWSGGSAANGTMNPFKWDYSSGKTWGYMAGGALVGGASGGFAGSIATSGMPMANTAAIMGGSFMNSVGMNVVTGGQTDVSIGFGVASYNITQGEWGYLGKKGNSFMQNLGYGLGAFANLSDAWAIAKGAYGNNVGEADLVTKNDPIGHSELRTVPDAKGNAENLISVGPDWDRAVRGDSFWDAPGYNDWPTHANDVGLDGLTVSKIRISNIRLDKVNQYVSGNLKIFRYSALNTNCVTSVSNALLKAGVLNMPFLRHPSLLQMQMFARRYSYFSPYMTNP